MSDKAQHKQTRKAARAGATQQTNLAAHELSEQELAAVVGGGAEPPAEPPDEALKPKGRPGKGTLN
jgi:bacteriocin-like protein